jgi:hypothetical protein
VVSLIFVMIAPQSSKAQTVSLCYIDAEVRRCSTLTFENGKGNERVKRPRNVQYSSTENVAVLYLGSKRPGFVLLNRRLGKSPFCRVPSLCLSFLAFALQVVSFNAHPNQMQLSKGRGRNRNVDHFSHMASCGKNFETAEKMCQLHANNGPYNLVPLYERLSIRISTASFLYE